MLNAQRRARETLVERSVQDLVAELREPDRGQHIHILTRAAAVDPVRIDLEGLVGALLYRTTVSRPSGLRLVRPLSESDGPRRSS
jgi:hypothetical protein